MTLLSLRELSVRRDNVLVVERVSFDISEGEVVGLIGPNGAGKTSLMRGALGLLAHDGTSNLTQLSARERARRVAWLPQSREIAWPVNVETLVTLGRVPFLSGGQRPRPEDREAVSASLAALDLEAFRHRPATQLSGGEQARVLIARALAQQAPLIIADEPTAGLDPAHQIATMKTFRKLAASGTATLVALHDLGLAARHCDRLLLLNNGRLTADGRPIDVLRDAKLSDAFGITAHLSQSEDGLIFQPLETKN